MNEKESAALAALSEYYIAREALDEARAARLAELGPPRYSASLDLLRAERDAETRFMAARSHPALVSLGSSKKEGSNA